MIHEAIPAGLILDQHILQLIFESYEDAVCSFDEFSRLTEGLQATDLNELITDFLGRNLAKDENEGSESVAIPTIMDIFLTESDISDFYEEHGKQYGFEVVEFDEMVRHCQPSSFMEFVVAVTQTPTDFSSPRNWRAKTKAWTLLAAREALTCPALINAPNFQQGLHLVELFNTVERYADTTQNLLVNDSYEIDRALFLAGVFDFAQNMGLEERYALQCVMRASERLPTGKKRKQTCQGKARVKAPSKRSRGSKSDCKHSTLTFFGSTYCMRRIPAGSWESRIMARSKKLQTADVMIKGCVDTFKTPGSVRTTIGIVKAGPHVSGSSMMLPDPESSGMTINTKAMLGDQDDLSYKDNHSSLTSLSATEFHDISEQAQALIKSLITDLEDQASIGDYAKVVDLRATQKVKGKRISKPRKTAASSSHFHVFPVTEIKKKRPPAGISCIAVPPLTSPTFGLIQEKLAGEPFQLFLAVLLLNKTKGEAAIPVFRSIIARYPTPPDLANAKLEDILVMIQHLGFQNQRAKKLIALAQAWDASPPVKDRRFRTLDYPCKGAHRGIKPREILLDDDQREAALEIGHLPGCGAYAFDSWRIFCRDRLRGRAEGWNGENASSDFEPEWKRVEPLDKELRAFLRWQWLKEGWDWDPLTGEKEIADQSLVDAVNAGHYAWDNKPAPI